MYETIYRQLYVRVPLETFFQLNAVDWLPHECKSLSASTIQGNCSDEHLATLYQNKQIVPFQKLLEFRCKLIERLLRIGKLERGPKFQYEKKDQRHKTKLIF